ncbi:MAG: CPBP family intramembrane metalloprotease [Bacteroidales bacterium]|nr:CPBP family intramembrane metalloprotease [Bacteroidales bacterium]MBN2817833.1 CPBP family intramembrane metalloprotease [Bacteroidales bacterium]
MSILTIGVITYFIGVLLSKFIFSMHLDAINHAFYGRWDELTDSQIKYYQAFQTFGFFILPGIFLHWILSASDNEYFNIRFKINGVGLVLTIIAFAGAIPLINWIVNLNQSISFPTFMSGIEDSLRTNEESLTSFSKRLLDMQGIPSLIATVFIIGALPAIGEEFIFRGVFQTLFKEILRNMHLSIIISAILFSAFHGEFFGFIPRFFLGLLLGYLMHWSKTIWMPVIGHFIFNSATIIICYLFQREKIGSLGQSLSIDGQFNLIVLVSLGVVIVMMFALRKLYANPQRN